MRRNPDDYCSFAVQVLLPQGWCTQDLWDNLPFSLATRTARTLHECGLTTRVWGYHRQILGGCGNGVIWDSRERER
jgi:hypothetical protein